MNPARRSLCIVSRDPLRCSELVLSLQALLDPDDEVEIILDRRREHGMFEAKSEGLDQPPVDRRRNPHVDLEVRTKGFAVVPAAPMTPRSSTAPDAAERERFESILSFKRRREARSGRVIAAAGVVMLALILSPPLNSLADRVAGDAPPSSEVTKSGPSEPGNRLGAIHPSRLAHSRSRRRRERPAREPHGRSVVRSKLVRHESKTRPDGSSREPRA